MWCYNTNVVTIINIIEHLTIKNKFLCHQSIYHVNVNSASLVPIRFKSYPRVSHILLSCISHVVRPCMSVIGLLVSTNLSFLYLLNNIIIVIRKRAVRVFLWKWEDIDNQVKYGTVFRYSCYYEKYVENWIFHGNSYLNCRKRIYFLILCHIIHVPLPETYCSIWTFLTSSSILSYNGQNWRRS